ncbi:Zinc finger, BED-type [Sesbania bispinosa]|nr:Zinc finger, BED-type [Sesbania bispinosa]
MPVTQTQGEIGDGNEDSTTQMGTRRLKSVVWKHFTKIKVNGEDEAKCIYCKKLLGGKSKKGTKHMHQHMDICI